MPKKPMNAPTPRTDHLALITLFLGAIAIGASPIFVRLSELGPFVTALYRPAFAIPALMLWVGFNGQGTKHPQSFRDIFLLISVGFLFAGDLIFWHLAIHNTSVANATLFASSAPIFVVAATWILFQQRLTPTFLCGLVITLLGAAFLTVGDLKFEPDHLKGDGFGIITALFLASYLIAVSRLRIYFSASTVMLWSSIGTTMALFPIALVSGEAMFAETVYGWAILLGLALVSHAVGQGFIAYSLAKISVNFLSLGLLIEPISAALLAVFILGEELSMWQVIGGIIILSGIVVARRDGK